MKDFCSVCSATKLILEHENKKTQQDTGYLVKHLNELNIDSTVSSSNPFVSPVKKMH